MRNSTRRLPTFPTITETHFWDRRPSAELINVRKYSGSKYKNPFNFGPD